MQRRREAKTRVPVSGSVELIMNAVDGRGRFGTVRAGLAVGSQADRIADSALFPKPIAGVFAFVGAQILVVLVDPVFAGRVEYIEVDGIHEGLGLVRHVAGNGQDFARVHDNFLTINPELERTLEDV